MAAEGMKSTKSQRNPVATAYLLLYNVVQTLGWSAILVTAIQYYMDHKTLIGIYGQVARLLNIFQTLAVMEVAHCAVGLVRANTIVTALQVWSRVFVTWGIAWSIKEVQSSYTCAMFIIAWTITEVIRYSFYALGLFDKVPYFLLWCRYTFFIFLYPIGVFGEMATIYLSLPYIKASGMYSIALPNAANIAFSYYYGCIGGLFSYIPGFPKLYVYMLKQRSKMLGGTREKKE